MSSCWLRSATTRRWASSSPRRDPGIHHTAYRCADVASAIEQCRTRGLRLIDEQPRRGIRDSLVAFLHPASTGGVLTELVQPAEGAH